MRSKDSFMSTTIRKNTIRTSCRYFQDVLTAFYGWGMACEKIADQDW